MSCKNPMTDYQKSLFILNWNGFKDSKVGLMGPIEGYIERIGWDHVDLSHALMFTYAMWENDNILKKCSSFHHTSPSKRKRLLSQPCL